MVEPHQGMVVAAIPEGGLEPPIGGVQPVGVVLALEDESEAGDFPLQLGLLEDAHVAARLVGVTARPRRQGPAQAFRPGPRHRRREPAAGLQHPPDFGQGRGVIVQVLKHLRADHRVEGGVREGQAIGVAKGEGGHRAPLAGRQFAQAVSPLDQAGGVHVEADHIDPPDHRKAMHVAAFAAA